MSTTAPTKPPEDHALRDDVLNLLANDSRFAQATIDVTAVCGVVTLAGAAQCWADRRAAEYTAYRVVGVCAVVNCIDVKPAWTARINHALR